MIQGQYRVQNENKKHPEFKKDEVVNVETIDRRNGLYGVSGKGQYKAKVLKGILGIIAKPE